MSVLPMSLADTASNRSSVSHSRLPTSGWYPPFVFAAVPPDWFTAWSGCCYPTCFINWNEGRIPSNSQRPMREGCMQAVDNGWSLLAAPLKPWFQPNIACVENTSFTSQHWLFYHLPYSSLSVSDTSAHQSHIIWGCHRSWWEDFLALCLRRKNTCKLVMGFIIISSHHSVTASSSISLENILFVVVYSELI